MRFLITTLQTYESEFYGAVGRELERRGHSVTHLTESRRSARELRSRGADAHCVLDVAAELGEPGRLDDEVRRIEGRTRSPTCATSTATTRRSPAAAGGRASAARSRTSARSSGSSTSPARRRAARGQNETIRVAAHLIASAASRSLFMLTRSSRGRSGSTSTRSTRRSSPATSCELTRRSAARSRRSARSFARRAKPIREHRRVLVHPPAGLARARCSVKSHRATTTTTTSAVAAAPPNAAGWTRAMARPFYGPRKPGGPTSTSRCT